MGIGPETVFIIDLGEANDSLSEQASFWLTPVPVINPSSHVIKSSFGVRQVVVLLPMKHCLLEFPVSVINNFLWDGGIGPMPNPQPGGPGF